MATIPILGGSSTLLDDYTAGTAQTADFLTPRYDLTRFGKVALQVVITGSSGFSGSIKLQSSVSAACLNAAPSFGSWDDISGSSVSFTGDGSYTWDDAGTGLPNVRAAITISAGSAKFQFYAFAKL